MSPRWMKKPASPVTQKPVIPVIPKPTPPAQTMPAPVAPPGVSSGGNVTNSWGAQGGTRFPNNFSGFSFERPCRDHDQCYANCGRLKSTCDNAFFADMSRECAKIPWHLAILGGQASACANLRILPFLRLARQVALLMRPRSGTVSRARIDNAGSYSETS